MAGRVEHDCRLARRAQLPARRPLRRRAALRSRRALALLDGDLAAFRPERPARAAARAARRAERARGLDDFRFPHGLDDLVDEVDGPLLRLVEDPGDVLSDHAEAQELDA